MPKYYPMKKILTLLFAASGSILHAQPTITSSMEPMPGTTITNIFLDSSTVQPGNSGANQVWDFSSAVTNGYTRTEEWMTVASTPFAANFPTASIAQKMIDTSGNDLFVFYNMSASSSDFAGTAFENNGIQWIMVYSDPSTSLQFPMNYNNTLTDNFAASASVFVDPVTMTAYRYGTYSYIIDGWGTLITPEATYSNVLRSHVHQYLTDSVVFSGAPIPTQVTHAISTSYFWGTSDAGNKRYQFYIGYDTTISASGTSVNISASYQSPMVTSVANDPSLPDDVSVYPNPANDVISVSFADHSNGAIEINVYDLLGNIVFKNKRDARSGICSTMVIPVSDLADGTYFVEVISSEKQQVKKIVKCGK